VGHGKTTARIATWTKVQRLPLCPNHNGSKRGYWQERDAQEGSLTVEILNTEHTFDVILTNP
jgi:hypothetical protein